MATEPNLPGNTGKAFDFQQLAQVSGGDTEFEREVLTDFVSQSSSLLDDVERAIASADATALERAAHSLKGSSATVGAVALATIGATLVQLGKTGQIASAAEMLQNARVEWARTQALILAYLDRGARKAG